MCIFYKIFYYFSLKMNEENLKNEGIAIHLLLEDYYLTSLIKECEKELKKENFEKLKDEINNIYLKKYIFFSQKFFNLLSMLNMSTIVYYQRSGIIQQYTISKSCVHVSVIVT